eukprot:COSAG02_NODE_57427_length_280_cov_1.408840_2_plen_43_part_01
MTLLVCLQIQETAKMEADRSEEGCEAALTSRGKSISSVPMRCA